MSDGAYYRKSEDGSGKWDVTVRRGTVRVQRRTRREARETIKRYMKGLHETDIAVAIEALDSAEKREESL